MPTMRRIARRRLLLLALAAQLFSLRLAAEQTIQCPPGTIDIVDWMTLDADLRGSKHMQANAGGGYMGTTVFPDKYFWVKVSSGDTMDINLFDSNFVYLWYTEVAHFQPFNYRKHTYDFNVPMTPRCATPGYPGSTMFVPDTSYSTYIDCELQGVSNVLRAVFKIWGPYTAGQPGLEPWRPRIGGDIPDSTPVYVLQYQYGCNANYQNCGDSEEYYFTQRHGFVRHEYWHAGQFVGRSTWNRLKNGYVAPYAPCLGGGLQGELGTNRCPSADSNSPLPGAPDSDFPTAESPNRGFHHYLEEEYRDLEEW